MRAHRGRLSLRSQNRANVFNKLDRDWEGDAPAEPRSTLYDDWFLRLGRSLALPWTRLPRLKQTLGLNQRALETAFLSNSR